ncbi:hypothetical protein WJX73_008649 [Symbiochloris irregularis]|uniref:Uncharacterized protein n=1 Tax=Symbiochloris irregularis TaxID=706552 RepID=A0AAW1PZB0_9CHLO
MIDLVSDPTATQTMTRPRHQLQKGSMQSRQKLSDLLLHVYSAIPRSISSRDLLPFLLRADQAGPPQVHSAVPKDQQVWLQKVLFKIMSMQYTKAADLLGDLELMHSNCRAALDKGCSSSQNCSIAQKMVACCRSVVRKLHAGLTAAEEDIQAATAEPAPAIEPRRVTPCGFQRVVKTYGDGQDRLPIMFQASKCKDAAHWGIRGIGKTVLRHIRELASFFKLHDGSRPEWQSIDGSDAAPIGQQLAERGNGRQGSPSNGQPQRKQRWRNKIIHKSASLTMKEAACSISLPKLQTCIDNEIAISRNPYRILTAAGRSG